MMFEKKRLDEICEFKYGKMLPSKKISEEGFPVFSGYRITGYTKKYLYKDPQLVIVARGVGGTGNVKISPPNSWITNLSIILEIKNDSVDQYFLMCLLNLMHLKETLDTGTAQSQITIEDLSSLKVNLPSINIQKNIANSLFLYENLIDKNLLTIKRLEELAKITFDELFLRFKVNDKKLEIDKKTLIPKNWKKIKLSDYVETISKGPTIDYNLDDNEGVPVLNQSCVRNGEIELTKILFAKKLRSEKEINYLRINDILINSMGDGTLGRVSKNISIDDKMIIHNCITYLRAKKKYSQYYLFYFLSLHKEYFELMAHGSTGQSTLKNEIISNLELLIPNKEIIESFDKKMTFIWKKMGVLKKQIKILQECREIILPRLVSGKIKKI